MASAVPERVDEAALLVDRLPELEEKWSRHIGRLGIRAGRFGHSKTCAHKGYGTPPRHMLVAAAAGSWRDLDALVGMVRHHKSCCIGTAALHAARRGRVDVVRALLVLIPPDDWGNMRLIGNVLCGTWLLVGRHGLLSVAEFLVGLEQGRDPVLCFAADERQELGRARKEGDDTCNIEWNWLSEAAKHNRTVCLDFCERHGLYDQAPYSAVGIAALQLNTTFYARIARHAQVPLMDAVSWCVRGNKGDMHPRALSWIVGQPEFDPVHDYPRSDYQLDTLFAHAHETGAADAEILCAAAILARRWPGVWERQREVSHGQTRDRGSPQAIDIWRGAADRLAAMYKPDDLPRQIRDDIDALFLA